MIRFVSTVLFVTLAAGCGGTRKQDLPATIPLFTEEERKAVAAYWSAPNRYRVEPSPDVSPTWRGRAWIEEGRKPLTGAARAQFDAWLTRRQAYDAWTLGGRKGAGPPAPGTPPGGLPAPPSPLHALERTNITVAGSAWHWRYAPLLRERREAKSDPASAEAAAWESWVAQRVAYEKGRAGGGPEAAPPGPMPPSLKAALGEPPPLFERVRPQRYTVTFAPEDAPAPFVYTDTILFGDRYAYYRSANGVVRYGRPLKDYAAEEKARLDALFAKAGRDTLERNVLKAVSRLEGGFEAVNTYDTGFVSIGFIQFITAREGRGSLAAVLQQHKSADPADFQATFRRFGIDVTPDAMIAVVDPKSGDELVGEEAVRKIIDDKRLTAVFERAGNRDGFRLAQVLVARARYWPGEDVVTVPRATVYEQQGGQTAPKALIVVYGEADAAAQTQVAATRQAERQKADPEYRSWVETETLTAPVSALVRSEAGMATLMDRKVNRGNLRGINEAAAAILRGGTLKRLEDVAKHERELVNAMKYRADFLADTTLTQP